MYLVSLLHSPFVSVSSSYYYDCGLNLGVVRAKKKDFREGSRFL